ncbi:MAG: dihydropteroate synthase, partial [Halopseudomonas aestusnigri]
GISEDPNVRYEVAKKIVQRAADHGISHDRIVVDPLVMPIGAMGTAGKQVFALLHRLKNELKVNTTCGASNISFGLPNRHAMNAHFLAMAAAAGMTSAIMNPLHEEELAGIRASDVLLNKDKNCLGWIKKYREPAAEGAGGAREGRRSRRRA